MPSNDSTVKFKADISQLKAEMQAASRQVRLANSEFKAATAGMDDWSSSADGLQKKIDQLTSVLEAQKKQAALANEEWEKTVKVYGENSAEADRAKIKLNNYQAAVNSTEKELGDYQRELKNVGDSTLDLEDATEKASDGFTVMKGALASLVADGIRLAIDSVKDFIADTIEVGQTFEKSMSNVQALSGANAEELKLLSDTAKEFGSSTQFSASEAADALGYMALAGWDAETSASALGGVLDLAAASGMELAEASDMVTDYMSAFNMKAEDSAYFADLLAYAQANANTSAQGLGEAFKNSAANMNAAGQDIETTVSLLSMMANQGLKGSEAGTALTAVMRDMTSKMKKGKIAIGETSIEVMDASGNYRDMTDILEDVSKATDGMGDAEKSAALMTTFTSDSIKGLNLLLNAGVDEAASFEEQLRNCSGSASEMAKTMNDNLTGDLTALNSQIEGVKIEVYESLEPALRSAVGKISETISSINWEMVGEAVGRFTEKVVDGFSYIMNNGDRIKSILKTIGSIIATVFVSNKIAGVGTTVLSLVSAFKKAETATGALSAVTKILGINMYALPIMMVIGAMGLLYTILQKQKQKMEENAQAAYGLTEEQNKLAEAISNSADALESANNARKEAGSTIDAEYSRIKDLKDQYNALIDENGKVKDGYQDVADTILTDLSNALGVAVDDIEKNIDANGKLGESIDELIEKKKNEAKINAFESDFNEAVKNQVENARNLADAKDEVAAAQDKLNEAQNKYNKAQEDWNNNLNPYARGELGKILNQTKEDLKVAEESYSSMNDKLVEAQNVWNNTQSTITYYHKAILASYDDNTQGVSDALLAMQYSLLDHNHASKSALEQQYIDSMTELNKIEQLYENGDISAEVVEDYRTINQLAGAELDKWVAKNGQAGADTVNNFTGSASAALQGAYKAAGQLGSGSTNALYNSLGDWGSFAEEKTGDYLGILGAKESEAQEKGANIGQASADGAKSKVSEFKSAAEDSANEYTSTIDSFSGEFSASGKLAADTTANGAEDEAEAMAKPAEAAVTSYAETIENMKDQAKTAGENLASEANSGADSKKTDAETSGSNFGEGFFNGIGSWLSSVWERGKELAKNAWNGLKEGQEEGSPSKLTTQSGKYFGEGFANGIKDTTKDVVLAATNMAKQAVQAERDAQQEGSPSKLTYQSGRNFTQGFINGISSLEKTLVSKTKSMVSTVLKELLKLENFNFSDVTSTASTAFSKALSKQMDYMSGWLQYQNQQMLADFDSTIENLQSASDSAVESATESSASKQAKIQKKIDKIEKIAESKRTKAQKKKLKKLKAQLAAEQAAVEKNTANIQSQYQSQIEEQQAMKEAYQQASSSMMSEFTSAMNEYATAAQKLIDDTMNGISSTYQSQYDALVNKQDNLIQKLQSAGDLFNVSSANVMTINDIQAQTAAIKQYASKLQEIKSKVSSDLFDQIAQYDMQQGEAFIDRLLAMSDAELKAYSDAYDEKLNVSEQLAESIYQSDFDKVADEYEKAMQEAFKNLPSQLETLGYQTMQGFLSGLTTNTDYMNSAIKTFVSGMVDQFKSQLGIHSPSKVAMSLGEFTGEGFADGLLEMVKTVKKAAQEIADTVSSSLDWNGDMTSARSIVSSAQGNSGLNRNAGSFAGNTQIINFNQTNNSPKALDRLTLYRQTNNMLFSAKVRLSDV